MEPEALSVGIDIAKAQLDVAVHPTDDRWGDSHDAGGVWQALALVEASGGLELSLVTTLATRRHQVLTMLVAERNRLGTATTSVHSHIAAHIAWREQELADLEQQLRQTLRQSPVWRAKDALLRTVPGVGPQLSLTLLAHLPELGTLRGKRTVWGGRARVRATLYRGALVASRYNPVIRAFYQRLLAVGKPKKLALTACMRKLLVILNAMLKHGSPWSDSTPRVAIHSA